MSAKYRIWFNGKIRDFDDCKVHVQSHALHYGSSVFEGIRAYKTPQGTAFFRLDDHLKRLFYSASIYRIPIRYSLEELRQACFDTVRDAGLESAYVRPLVMRGNCGLGVIPRDLDITIGKGGCGPITKRIQTAFFGLFNGVTENKYNWLAYL